MKIKALSLKNDYLSTRNITRFSFSILQVTYKERTKEEWMKREQA